MNENLKQMDREYLTFEKEDGEQIKLLCEVDRLEPGLAIKRTFGGVFLPEGGIVSMQVENGSSLYLLYKNEKWYLID